MISRARRPRTLLQVTAGVGLLGLALAACGGGDDDPEALDLSSVTAPATTASTASGSSDGWDVSKKKDAEFTAELKDISTTIKDLQKKLESDDMDVYFKADKEETKQEGRLIELVTEMSKATTGTGIGHVACVAMPVQLLTLSASEDEPDRAKYVAIDWIDPVRTAAQAGGNKATLISFTDVKLDEQMQKECSDVRQDVLDFTGVKSIDALYDTVDVKSS